jgi:hypothetical protein
VKFSDGPACAYLEGLVTGQRELDWLGKCLPRILDRALPTRYPVPGSQALIATLTDLSGEAQSTERFETAVITRPSGERSVQVWIGSSIGRRGQSTIHRDLTSGSQFLNELFDISAGLQEDT